MSFFCPSKITNFVQISHFRPNLVQLLKSICKWTNMYWFQNAAFLYITVDLFHWKVRVLLMCNQRVACTAQACCRLNWLYGLINYRYLPNDWCHNVVPAVQCIRSLTFILWKKINSRHPFFQPNCKSIIVMPSNEKEFCHFLAIGWPFSVQVSSKIVNLVFSSKMPNFVMSFVFRPKWIFCVFSHSSRWLCARCAFSLWINPAAEIS